MRKYFHGSVLFLCILALFVSGCGGGSAADPMGTATVQFIQEYNEPIGTGSSGKVVTITKAEVEPNSSLTLTVWVSNFTSDGKVVPVIGEKVSFWLDSPGNGASLSVLNDRTASNGQARVVYAAGYNLYPDVVRVQTSAGATASITIIKTGRLPRGSVVALSATPTSVIPLGFSTITATVTDPTTDPTKPPVPIKGERVTFALLTDNGASLTIQSGLTNAAGQVTTVYQAGNNNNQDVVQASLSSGVKAQIVITKSGVAPGRSITLAATPSSVAPGRYSLITATLKDSGGNVVSGVRVNFHLTTSNGSIDRNEVTTDGSGVATIIYYAWNNFDSDVLQATTEDGAFAQLIITKTGQTVGYRATMTATPNTFKGTAAVVGILNSTLTVTVLDNNSLPAQGLRVRFNPPPGISAPAYTSILVPTSAVTGIDGKASVTFTGQLTGAGTIVVDAYVDVDDNGIQDPTDPTAATTLTVTVD